VDSSKPEAFPVALAEILGAPDDIVARGRAAHDYAQRNFTQAAFADRFEKTVFAVLESRRDGQSQHPDS
jgi:hypothetical protein